MRTYDIYEYSVYESVYCYIGSITGAKALRHFLTGKHSMRWFSTCGMYTSSADDPFTWYPKYKVFDDKGRERDILEILTKTPKKGEPYRVGNWNSSYFHPHRFKFREGPVEGIGHQKWHRHGIWRHPHTTQEKRYRMSERERNELRQEYGINFQGPRNRYLPSVYDDIMRPHGRNTKKNQKNSHKGDWNKTHRPGKSALRKKQSNQYSNHEQFQFLPQNDE